YIEQRRPGSVGHVGGAHAGQAEAHGVLGEQQVAHAVALIWFVFTDPENFRESEVGKRGVRGELNQALEAKGSREFAALFFGANVAPDERGANDIPAFIDKDRAVHLRSEEHTSELQSRFDLVCRLLLEKK